MGRVLCFVRIHKVLQALCQMTTVCVLGCGGECFMVNDDPELGHDLKSHFCPQRAGLAAGLPPASRHSAASVCYLIIIIAS